MPSPDQVASISINYRLILTQYHQEPTIIAVQYTASSPRNAQMSQLDLVCYVVTEAKNSIFWIEIQISLVLTLEY